MAINDLFKWENVYTTYAEQIISTAKLTVPLYVYGYFDGPLCTSHIKRNLRTLEVLNSIALYTQTLPLLGQLLLLSALKNNPSHISRKIAHVKPLRGLNQYLMFKQSPLVLHEARRASAHCDRCVQPGPAHFGVPSPTATDPAQPGQAHSGVPTPTATGSAHSSVPSPTATSPARLTPAYLHPLRPARLTPAYLRPLPPARSGLSTYAVISPPSAKFLNNLAFQE
ncbi:hypothetical protein J6590_020169 [Homalodisca vitripennis]|nr:hypothetical protein J6590_020169 [Homalodisca vitripennis]